MKSRPTYGIAERSRATLPNTLPIRESHWLRVAWLIGRYAYGTRTVSLRHGASLPLLASVCSPIRIGLKTHASSVRNKPTRRANQLRCCALLSPTKSRTEKPCFMSTLWAITKPISTAHRSRMPYLLRRSANGANARKSWHTMSLLS